MTRKILELTTAVFLVVCTVAVVVAGVRAQGLAAAYVAAQEVRATALHDLTAQVQDVAGRYVAVLEFQAQAQADLLATYNQINQVAYEGGIAFLARALEEEGGLSSSDAGKIIAEAIDNIEDRSERLGRLAKALHDASRR